jgi:hypothetical protein
MVVGALALVGCGKDEPTTSTAPMMNDESSGGGGSETSNGTTETPSVTTTTAPNPTSGTTAGETGPDDTGPPATTFLIPPDNPGGECDIWKLDDCPEGQKCMPYANDGGGSWNDTKCSPIDANPGQVGDECTVEGSAVSGIDSCDNHVLCWFVDENNQGICIPMCDGTPEAPFCGDGQTCDVSNEGSLILCLDTCDPTIASCDDGLICFFDGVDEFICDFDASGEEGQYGDPCAFINVCDYGLFCANPEAVPDCQDASGCCSEFCNLMEPNSCMGAPQQECVPWYAEGEAPPGQENIGACAIPA